MEHESPVIGEAADLTLSVSKSHVMIGEKVILTAIAKDTEGHYLPTGGVKYSVEGGDDVIFEGNVFSIVTLKGERIITAEANSLKASVSVYAIASPEAENLIAGKAGVTDTENIQGGTVENVTDADRNSQLEWACGNTEEHYLIYDLGAEYYIEAIDLLFEGAYATDFTVSLTAAAPAELGANALAAQAAGYPYQDKVFTPTANNTQHYFIQDPLCKHRYVTLRTTKALNTGWGIKVRDLKVYGTELNPTHVSTGVEDVIVEDNADAPVEYYNLNGQRVENPAAGLYIRRQGNKVTKVLVK